MKAVVLEQHNGATTLTMSEIDRPTLEPGAVRIAVRAASVNRADLLIRAGTHTPAANPEAGPAVAGLDVAGEIIEVGDEVRDLRVGDNVMAMVAGGLAAEVVTPAAMAIPLPSAWSYVEGAAAVIALMTEHNALVTAGKMKAGDTVLVHAAASGVGTQAVQLAVLLGAGKVIGTTRSHGDSPVLKGRGINELITVADGAFADQVLKLTQGHGADVILDHVGGPYLEENLRAAALAGRIVGVGRLGGRSGTLDLEELARKRLEIVGTTFRTRSAEEKASVVSALRTDVDLEQHADALRPIVDQTCSWFKALDAQETLAHNTHVGKIVLEIQ
jgi:NADPH2:quinone reductase